MNDRKRHIGGETKCVMCNHDWEDLNHFVFWCAGYSDLLRGKERLLQQPYIQDEEYLLGQLLFVNSDRIKEVLHRFWKIREKKKQRNKRVDLYKRSAVAKAKLLDPEPDLTHSPDSRVQSLQQCNFAVAHCAAISE